MSIQTDEAPPALAIELLWQLLLQQGSSSVPARLCQDCSAHHADVSESSQIGWPHQKGEQADRQMEHQSNKAITGVRPSHVSVWIELLAEHGSLCILDFNQICTVTMVKYSNGQIDLHKLIFSE